MPHQHSQACADKLDNELTKYGVPPKFPTAEEAAAAELEAAEAAGEVEEEEVRLARGVQNNGKWGPSSLYAYEGSRMVNWC